MKCGVRFCGGCNPSYDRGKAYEHMKNELDGEVELLIAQEDESYDALLVIGGCSNCCASYEQFDFKGEPVKIWYAEHIEGAIEIIRKLKDNL